LLLLATNWRGPTVLLREREILMDTTSKGMDKPQHDYLLPVGRVDTTIKGMDKPQHDYLLPVGRGINHHSRAAKLAASQRTWWLSPLNIGPPRRSKEW
jgi:hypothetical protein